MRERLRRRSFRRPRPESGTGPSPQGRNPDAESVKFRRHAVEKDIECLTALDTANALADCLKTNWSLENLSLVDIKTL